jgi:TonB family protein
VAGDVRAPVAAELPTTPGRSDVATSSSALHEVIPEVPHGAHRTIRGHIKVWVRVIVDQDGSVNAATLDRTGSSRYFQRLAIEAAKKWTFPPIDTPSRRVMQVRFDFSRDGITGHAVTLD